MVDIAINKRTSIFSVFCKWRVFISLFIIFVSGCSKLDESCIDILDKSNSDVKIIAHAGYWKTKDSAKNSLVSLKKAGELGIYGAEFDVWKTKDDRIVLHHDPQYHNYLIANSSFSDLRRSTLTISNGEIIPSLEELFEVAKEYPEIQLVIELKSTRELDYDKKSVELILDCMNKYSINDRIDFISLSLEACRLFEQKSNGNLVEYLGEDFSLSELHRYGINGIDYSYSSLLENPNIVCRAKMLGMYVNTWTVNNIEEAYLLKQLGVDMITTDIPAVMFETIDNN